LKNALKGGEEQIPMDITGDLSTKKKHLNVTIRQMEIDDFPAVFHLGEKLFRAQKVPNLYRTWDEFEVISLYQGDPEFCLVVEVEEQIIGFALGNTISKSHSAWKYGHLIWLGIAPAFQRKNIATRLFNRFRDLMLENGVRMLLVDTEAGDLPALRFFQKMGFGNPQKHIYMTLNLAAQRRAKRDDTHAQTRSRHKNHA
jgi:ribosomal protein S18 acetylase RimI-like enzyme